MSIRPTIYSRVDRQAIRVMYEIIYTESVFQDLRELRADKRAKILDSIEEQLTYEPTKATRN